MTTARRKTIWVDTVVVTSVASGAVEEISLLTGISDAEGFTEGWTLIRTLVNLYAIPAAAGAAFGSNLITVGMGQITQDAFVAAALPELGVQFEEPQAGWVFKNIMVTGVNPTEEEWGLIGHMQMDIRSQRKMGSDPEMYLQMQSTLLDGTGQTLRISGLIRCLYKLR